MRKRKIFDLAIMMAFLFVIFLKTMSLANAAVITQASQIAGSDLTNSPALAQKLDSIFRGNASVYSNANCTNLVNTSLGTYSVPNNGVKQYVGAYGKSAKNSGTSCWIYANGVYYTLFGEALGNGSPGKNSTKLDLTSGSGKTLTYSNLCAWGVYDGVGAQVRVGSHSLIILKYNSSGMIYLDGNGDGKGLVAVRDVTWAQVKNSSNTNGTVQYIIQPKQSYRDATYPEQNKYTLSFDTGAGSSVSSITAEPGATVTIPSTIPTYFGWDFVYWMNGSDIYRPGDSITLNEDITLVATWVRGVVAYSNPERISTRIRYPGAGTYLELTVPTTAMYQIQGVSTNEMDTIIKLYDQNFNLMASDDDGGENWQFKLERYLEAGKTYYVYITPYSSSATGTMYWDIRQGYNVDYWDLFEEGTGYGMDYCYPNIFDLTQYETKIITDIPEKSGYTFAGWSTTPNSQVAMYQPGQQVTVQFQSGRTPADGVDLRLYPVWLAEEDLGSDFYAHIMHPASGYGICNVNGNVELGEYWTTSSLWHFSRQPDNSYIITSGLDGNVIDVYNNDTDDGSNVQVWENNDTSAQKWYIKAEGDGYSLIGASSKKALDIQDGSIDLGANAIIYTPNGTNAQIFQIVKAPECGFTHDSQFINLNIDGDNSQIITFKTYGAFENTITITWSSPTLQCSWGEWLADGTIPLTVTASSTDDTYLYVTVSDYDTGEVFAEQYYYPEIHSSNDSNYYLIQYNANGGTGGPEYQYKSHGRSPKLSSAEPSWAGYDFVGWATDPAAIQAEYYPGDKYIKNAGVTLYAVWRKHVSGDIRERKSYYHQIANPGVGTSFNFSVSQDGIYHFRGQNDSSLDTRIYIYDEDWVCIGSDDDSGGNYQFSLNCELETGINYTVHIKPYRAEETGKLQWDITRAYPLRYIVDGEVEKTDYCYLENSSASTCYCSAVLLNYIPAKPGYAFLGWSRNVNAATGEYQPGENALMELSDASVNPGTQGQATLYAIWERSGTCGENLKWILDDSGTLTISGTGAMENYLLHAPWYEYRSLVQTVVIENGVTTIGNDAFADCRNLTAVTIPESVTSIGTFAFSSCSSLTGITIPNSVTSIGDYAFFCCSSLIGITIPGSVTSIGVQVFFMCSSLENIMILEGVTSIGTSAFYGCSMTSITIPASVTSIGYAAFEDCSSLTSITIPDSVTSIDMGAFYNCSSLSDVYYIGTQAQWNAISIGEGNTCLTGATLHIKPIVTQIAIETLPNKVVYQIGEKFDSDGLRLSVTYKDGSSENISSGFTISGFSSTAAGTKTVTVTYEGKTTTFNVTVSVPYVTAIAIKTQPTKTSYWTGESLDTTGLTLTATYSDGSTKTVSSGFTTSGFSSTTAGTKTVTVAYEGKTTTFTVTVMASGVIGSNGESFATLAEAVSAVPEGSTLTLCKDVVGDTAVKKNLNLDLNGYNIYGTVNVAAGCTLYCFDSQTDDNTVNDEASYGVITRVVGNVQGLPEKSTAAEDGYLMVCGDEGISFHRVKLQLTAMTLRASQAGVYYKSIIAGDEVVAEQVAQFGVALSVYGAPAAGDQNSVYSWFEGFQAGSNNQNSTLLHSIMKETLSAKSNTARAAMPIYGRAYILTKDGQYLFGTTVSRSLQEQVEEVDAMWSQLTFLQQMEMATMYQTYSSVMQNWALPDLQAVLSSQVAMLPRKETLAA